MVLLDARRDPVFIKAHIKGDPLAALHSRLLLLSFSFNTVCPVVFARPAMSHH